MTCNTLRNLVAAGVAWCCIPMASADRLFNQCNIWPEQHPNDLTLTYNFQIGDFFVPVDAPIGTVIGDAFGWTAVMNDENLQVHCNRNGIDPWPIFYSNVVAVRPIYPGPLPNIAGRDITGKVFETNIRGVGIAFEYESPYNSSAQNQFYTPSRLPPLLGVNDHRSMPTGFVLSTMGVKRALIKIGDIPPGVNVIDTGVLYKGDFTGVPNAYTVAVRGTVSQAQCSLSPTNPVSDVPVPLGTWNTSDFSGPGSATTAVPFHLNLLNCVDDPSGSVAMANVRLEGALGSTIIDKDLGLFSLDPGSTATGVGIQMLQGDGITAIPLSEDVPIARIAPSGAMQLNLSARFYQLPGSSFVTGGSATGALSFTITYQ
jgi:type 1 fimbria pilin